MAELPNNDIFTPSPTYRSVLDLIEQARQEGYNQAVTGPDYEARMKQTYESGVAAGWKMGSQEGEAAGRRKGLEEAAKMSDDLKEHALNNAIKEEAKRHGKKWHSEKQRSMSLTFEIMGKLIRERAERAGEEP